MTVIAWDGKTLAADKRAVWATTILTTTKIHRVRGCLVGFAGDSTFGREMLEWFRNGEDPANFPASQRDKEDWCGLLVIRPDGAIDRYERTPYAIRFEDERIAIGAGREFALAAMYLGHGARRAVEVACALDNSGNGIDCLTLE